MGKPLSPKSGISELPAAVATELLALRYLQNAKKNLKRLERGVEDSEALHDFRVTVRKLRVHLATYQDSFSPPIRPKAGRRLKKVMRSTNDPRDLEVEIRWLETRLPRMSAQKRRCAETLLSELRSGRQNQQTILHERVRARFHRAEGSLKKSLGRFSTLEASEAGGLDLKFGWVAARKIAAEAGKLERQLCALTADSTSDTFHHARISGKRLRYLIAPFVEEAPALGGILTSLKVAQDFLGDLRDRQLLAALFRKKQAEAPGTRPLNALTADLQAEKQRLERDFFHFRSHSSLLSQLSGLRRGPEVPLAAERGRSDIATPTG